MKNFSFRSFAWVFAISMLCACSSFAEGVGVSDLLSMQEKHVDQQVSVDGVVGFHDGYCIVDAHDKNKFMPLAIPVRLFDEVKSLLGQEVVVDGELQAHKFEERANSIEFSPTQLLVSKIKSKSAGK